MVNVFGRQAQDHCWLLAVGYLGVHLAADRVTVNRVTVHEHFICHEMWRTVNGKRITVNGFVRQVEGRECENVAKRHLSLISHISALISFL
jgi:hypothetical protein